MYWWVQRGTYSSLLHASNSHCPKIESKEMCSEAAASRLAVMYCRMLLPAVILSYSTLFSAAMNRSMISTMQPIASLQTCQHEMEKRREEGRDDTCRCAAL